MPTSGIDEANQRLLGAAPFPLEGGRVGVGGAGNALGRRAPEGSEPNSAKSFTAEVPTPNPTLPPSRGKGFAAFTDRYLRTLASMEGRSCIPRPPGCADG